MPPAAREEGVRAAPASQLTCLIAGNTDKDARQSAARQLIGHLSGTADGYIAATHESGHLAGIETVMLPASRQPRIVLPDDDVQLHLRTVLT
ncbi:hypothetical protein D3C80_1898690 [compost metagenome]